MPTICNLYSNVPVETMTAPYTCIITKKTVFFNYFSNPWRRRDIRQLQHHVQSPLIICFPLKVVVSSRKNAGKSDFSHRCAGAQLGLDKTVPGDLSSQSRFVRAAFVKLNSVSGTDENASVSQFFHILTSVEQQRGLVHMGEGKYEITIYSSCCNTDKGIYYYTTYENSQITGVDMHKENLEGDQVVTYPLIVGQQIRMQN